MGNKSKSEEGAVSRREFLTGSAAATAGLVAAGIPAVHAGASETLRVGLVGCGGRGTGALRDLVNAAPDIRIVALGDLFPERVERCFASMEGATRHGGAAPGTGRRGVDPAKLAAAWKVTRECCFTGFDNYRKVLDSGIDLGLLCTPPGFRPTHFQAAVAAGKHVFMEKPVATCPTGVRIVLEASRQARQKGLAVVAGTQRRHTPAFVETMRRIHAGDLGELVAGQCYWNGSGIWNRESELKAEWSELERQCWNWYHFAWICGDQIVEQHVHNLDVINWAFSRDGLAHPDKCLGMGGRQVRVTPGNIWDHFTVEYEYANGARVMSMCRHWEGCPSRQGERLAGTRGTAIPGSVIEGERPFRYEGPQVNGQVQEHADLVASIRGGKPLNEGDQIANSSLMAIMGRMSAYTGQEVTWEFALNQSKQNYVLDHPKPGPGVVEAMAVPGKTRLV